MNILTEDLVGAVVAAGIGEDQAARMVCSIQQTFGLFMLNEAMKGQRMGERVTERSLESHETGKLNFLGRPRELLKRPLLQFFEDREVENALVAIERLISEKLDENDGKIWICGIGEIKIVQVPIWVLRLQVAEPSKAGV